MNDRMQFQVIFVEIPSKVEIAKRSLRHCVIVIKNCKIFLISNLYLYFMSLSIYLFIYICLLVTFFRVRFCISSFPYISQFRSQYVVRVLWLCWITSGDIIHPSIEGLLPPTAIKPTAFRNSKKIYRTWYI